MIKKPFIVLLISVCTLAFLSLACSLGGPTADSTAYPTLEATALAQSLETSIAITPETQTAVITVNEQQVTSYLSQKLAEQPDAPFNNPQVILRDGRVEIYGTAGNNFVSANVKMVVKPMIDSQGQPNVELESANFGPIPIPSSLADYLTGLLTRAIEDGFGSNPDRMQILDLQIENGLATITLQQMP